MTPSPYALETQSSVQMAARAQKQAADPDQNVWVMASAGTGKTTILVDRYIRLVLRGAAPEKILCLTYTKAAATQMKDRILARLSKWAVLNDDDLRTDIEAMTGQAASKTLLSRARGLLITLLESLESLQIMTIHAFCQSLLLRFQIESGMDGQFTIMQDSQRSAIFSHVIEFILANDDDPFIDRLLDAKGDTEWEKIVHMINSARGEFIHLLQRDIDVSPPLNDLLGLKENDTEESITSFAIENHRLPMGLLSNLCKPGSEKDATFKALILESGPRAHLFEAYLDIFMKKDRDPRATPRGLCDEDKVAFMIEQARLGEAVDAIKSVRTRDLSLALYKLAGKALAMYALHKQERRLVDYDDLIEKTVALLSHAPSADWIRYKMDGGVDHVLVDEAQDTNPQQWLIVQKLIEEYFAGSGTRDPEDRTLFVVGDQKQSIYGFQGADPSVTSHYHNSFSAQAAAAHRAWLDIPLGTSFRTAQSILDIVDACDLWPEARHSAGRGDAGRVELWPLITQEQDAKPEEPWSLPADPQPDTRLILIEKVADKIKELLDQAIALPSKKGAAITPSDILILVQTRTHYPQPMIKALQLRGINVAGIDSFTLSHDTAVRDVLGIIRWALFPEDDLTLAECLKSPFVGWDDDTLARCAQSRDGQLWQVLQSCDRDLWAWFRGVQNLVRHQPCDVIVQTLLEGQCPASRHSGWDAMVSRLGAAAREPLEQLIMYARTRDPHEACALSFLHHLEQNPLRIKREVEGDEAGGVRVMTTHGAKGLEAPVVILLDTILSQDIAQKSDDLQWAPWGRDLIPLYAGRKADRAPFLDDLCDESGARETKEYHRLLYVAMTRAKDYLIVAGAEGHHTPKPQSWYFFVQHAMQKLGARADEDGVLIYGDMPMDRALKPSFLPATTSTAPLIENPSIWYMHEPENLDNLSDNLPSLPDRRALSIGRQWHKLLERAMEHDSAHWPDLMALWTEDLPDIDPALAMKRLLALRAHETYGFLFAPGAAAELPFMTNQDSGSKGRIDRLVIAQGKWWIVDYKTNIDLDNPAQMAEYAAQLAQYRAALLPIASGADIKTVLVDIASAAIIPINTMA